MLILLPKAKLIMPNRFKSTYILIIREYTAGKSINAVLYLLISIIALNTYRKFLIGGNSNGTESPLAFRNLIRSIESGFNSSSNSFTPSVLHILISVLPPNGST